MSKKKIYAISVGHFRQVFCDPGYYFFPLMNGNNFKFLHICGLKYCCHIKYNGCQSSRSGWEKYVCISTKKKTEIEVWTQRVSAKSAYHIVDNKEKQLDMLSLFKIKKWCWVLFFNIAFRGTRRHLRNKWYWSQAAKQLICRYKPCLVQMWACRPKIDNDSISFVSPEVSGRLAHWDIYCVLSLPEKCTTKMLIWLQNKTRSVACVRRLA